MDETQLKPILELIATGAAAFAGAWMRSASLTREVFAMKNRMAADSGRLDAIEERLRKIEGKLG